MAPPTSFFLPGPAGNLFAMYYPPRDSAPDRGDVLYVHPFASEMFVSRNVVAAMARDLAASGLGVMTIDLYGCGDSAGDFADARWEIWRDDLAAATRWLREQGRERLGLWGLRLGALLAMDFAARSGDAYERMVLWQPVLSGEHMLNEFLRTHAHESSDPERVRRLLNAEARSALPAGEKIEVAGYETTSELMRDIDRQALALLGTLVRAPIHWVEFVNKAEQPVSPDSRRVMDEWRSNRVQVSGHKHVGMPFWLFPHVFDHRHLEAYLPTMFGDPE